MFVNAQPGYLSFNNPLINQAYERYVDIQKDVSIQKNKIKKVTTKDLLSFSARNVNKTVKELQKIQDKECITVEDYFVITKQIQKVNQTESKKITQFIINNQNQVLMGLLEMINTSLKLISDEQVMKHLLVREKDLIKKAYFPTVIRIQKTILGELREELIKSQKNYWRILERVPVLNFLAFGIRTSNLIRFNRSIAATNILVIRLTKIFNKNKIKNEITQVYEEFADAGVLEPKHKFDKYNQYIANAIKT